MALVVSVFTLMVISTTCYCGILLDKLSSPGDQSFSDSKTDQTLSKHVLNQGFKYEVRFPPSPPRRNTPQATPSAAAEHRGDGSLKASNTDHTSMFQQYNDGRSKLDNPTNVNLLEMLDKTGSNGDHVISCEDLEPKEESSNLEHFQTPEQYEGYQYLQPSSKLTIPDKRILEDQNNPNSNRFTNSAPEMTDSFKIFTDPLDSHPAESNVQEVTWMDEVSSNALTAGPANLQGKRQYRNPTSQSEDLADSSMDDQVDSTAQETYSSVRFTGSVFTEEGLPVLANDTDLPVDYRFVYLIRGEPELGHEEARVEDTARGRYWVRLPDGRLQEVTYVADAEGYRPTITYRQPGQDSDVQLS